MEQSFLVIDVGNTYTKIGSFKDSKLIFSIHFESADQSAISNYISQLPGCDSIIISSVIFIEEGLENLIKSRCKQFYKLSSTLKIPFYNKYKTSETLGNDRLAAVSGALKIFPASNVLIIDSGTCITYDLLTDKSEYLGGSISPGMAMRFKALHHFTGKLPLVKIAEMVSLIGDSTENSILSGVIHGVVYEVSGYISVYYERFQNLKVMLTGGDSNFISKNLKNNSIFVEPNLVLIGLNEILNCNVKK